MLTKEDFNQFENKLSFSEILQKKVDKEILAEVTEKVVYEKELLQLQEIVKFIHSQALELFV